jgi:hypothetical protein
MTEFQLPLMLSLLALVGIAIVFWKIQTGAIESRKMVVGAALLLVASGTALAVLVMEDSAARAELNERLGVR